MCAVALNLFYSAFYLLVIMLAGSRGVRPGQIGIMAAMLGVGGLLGALAALHLAQVLSSYVSIISVFWVLATLTPVAAFVDNGYLLGLLFTVMALLPTMATPRSSQSYLYATPDDMRARLSSVLGIVTGVTAALGPGAGWVASHGSLRHPLGAGVRRRPHLRSFHRQPVIAESPEVEPKCDAEQRQNS